MIHFRFCLAFIFGKKICFPIKITHAIYEYCEPVMKYTSLLYLRENGSLAFINVC